MIASSLIKMARNRRGGFCKVIATITVATPIATYTIRATSLDSSVSCRRWIANPARKLVLKTKRLFSKKQFNKLCGWSFVFFRFRQAPVAMSMSKTRTHRSDAVRLTFVGCDNFCKFFDHFFFNFRKSGYLLIKSACLRLSFPSKNFVFLSRRRCLLISWIKYSLYHVFSENLFLFVSGNEKNNKLKAKKLSQAAACDGQTFDIT